MHILVHICCGPCAIYPAAKLLDDGHQVNGFFYNPNIHPYQEFRRRLDTLEQYAGSIGLPVDYCRDYDLNRYLRQVVRHEERRCEICYRLRLEETARAAKEGGYDAFTTTLLVSPYQKHDLVKSIGEEMGKKFGISFYYEDFRPGFSEARRKSKELEMYRQQYCGCIYSEAERYCPSKRPTKG